MAIASVVLPFPTVVGLVVPPVTVVGVIGSGLISSQAALSSLHPLVAPVAFVLLAVPLAVLLDKYGFFEELSGRLVGRRNGLAGLWVLAAVVTAVLNLDAAVVLLSPIYLRIAQRSGLSAFALCLQPALLSGLASSLLPISNVTNLIVAAKLHIGAVDFVVHLGLPTLIAVAIGWVCYKALFSRIVASGPKDSDHDAPGNQEWVQERPASRTLAVGGAICVVVVAGFVAAPSFGGQPFEVAGVADLVLMALTSSIPWRSVPIRITVLVASLGILATAVGKVLSDQLISGQSPIELVRTTFVVGAASNVVNNLPAVLVALPHLTRHSWTLWAVLLGTNVGAIILPSGSLAVLLWITTMRRLGLDVHERHYLRIGWLICLPALLGACATLVVLRVVLGSGG